MKYIDSIKTKKTQSTLGSHKIKYIDVMLEMKKKNYYETDIRHSGKIYTNISKEERTHPFYIYFKNYYYHNIKWEHTPTQFVKKLKQYCYDFMRCEACRSYEKEQEKRNHNFKIVCDIIDKWLSNGEGKFNKFKWDLNELFYKMECYGQYDGKFYGLNECYTLIDKSFPIPDTENILDKHNAIHQRNRLRRQTRENTMFRTLQLDFTRFTSLKKSAEKFDNIYTLKINRVWEGKSMNYENSPMNKYSILRWKKTLPNGNCSNKGLTATYLYTISSEYRNKYNTVYTFEAVKQHDAINCVKMNGFPAWGKETGNKKPTYKEMKMWWYKLK